MFFNQSGGGGRLIRESEISVQEELRLKMGGGFICEGGDTIVYNIVYVHACKVIHIYTLQKCLLRISTLVLRHVVSCTWCVAPWLIIGGENP